MREPSGILGVVDADELELERAWLRELLDTLPTPVSVYGPDGHIEFANRARLALTGPSVSTMSEAATLLAPEHEDGAPFRADELPPVRALAGESVTGERMRLRTVDGRTRVMLANASPLRSRDGAIIGAVLVYHDITELSELERGRRELFSMANHDLRTPLTTILGFVQLARRQLGGDTERTLRTLADIERQCLRMVRLVHDLLDVARFESGAIPVAAAPGDLRERVRLAVERQAAEARVTVDVPDTEVRARFDPDRIDQILDNLLANGVRHTKPGTNVDMTLRIEGGEAVLRVRDRGAGIDADEQARLFTPFYQTQRSRSYGGTGLGLHISRRIAEAHHGRLWLESTGPDGSTFALALPHEPA